MIHDNLEYLMSSLPFLSFKNTLEEQEHIKTLFRKYAGDTNVHNNLPEIVDAEAGKFLSRKSHSLFSQLSLDSIHLKKYRESNIEVLSKFAIWSQTFKNSIAELRSTRREKTKKSKGAKSILPIELGNPLEEEVQLLRLQWDKAEELSAGHYSDFSALVLYKIKLMILTRWWSFNKSQGLEIFQNLTNAERTWQTRS